MSITQPTAFTADHFRFPIPNTPRLNQNPPGQQPAVSLPSTPSSSTSSSLCRPLRPTQQQSRNQRTDVALENPAELEEFMQQGEEFCINEMKKFITQYSLRQTTVAQMTGKR